MRFMCKICDMDIQFPFIHLKGKLTPQKNILSLFTHTPVVPNLTSFFPINTREDILKMLRSKQHWTPFNLFMHI